MSHPRKSDRRQAQQQENAEFESYDRGQFRINPFVPITSKQADLYESILNNPMCVAIGPAGTAKSYTAAAAAIRLLTKNLVDAIVITRNPVPTGFTTGFKPGTMEEKMLPWMAPILGNLRKVCEGPTGKDGFFNYLMKNKKIQMVELETLKGMNFDNKIVILEEAQETTMEQLKNLSTRMGENAYLYMDGDIAQGNERLKGSRDFDRFVKGLKSMNNKLDAGTISLSESDSEDWGVIRVPVVEFDKNDCVRSGQCRWMLEMFEVEEL